MIASMGVVQLVTSIQRKTEIELDLKTKDHRRRRAALLLGLCSLLHSCAGLVVPCAFGRRTTRLESVARRQQSWLSLTKTKSPTSSELDLVSYMPMMTEIPGEVRVTMTSENEIVNSDEDEVDDNEESRDDNDAEDSQDLSEEDDDEQLKRRTAAAAAALLGRKRGVSRSKKPLKSTSVGTRRVGSATKGRRSHGGTYKIMDAVRTVAAAASDNTNTTAKTSEPRKNSTSKKQIGSSVIQATISSLLESQNIINKKLDDKGMTMNTFHGPIGLLGERPDPLSHELLRNPMPGTMLVFPSVQNSRRASPGTLSVRVATPDDDFQIANLRLSVFSDFSSELRKQFCARSCQVLADRRLRGATCLVATCPSSASRNDVILGSVECSVHEFYATKLGRRRPKLSALYITEVAVNPSIRRCGIGSKLLQGVDELAALRNVESLYLHVDVLNFGALELYRKAGYRKVNHGDAMYSEFTTSLNLHDGATKGRRHYLLCKDLVPNPTWLALQEECTRGHQLSRVDTATWGFEITSLS